RRLFFSAGGGGDNHSLRSPETVRLIIEALGLDLRGAFAEVIPSNDGPGLSVGNDVRAALVGRPQRDAHARRRPANRPLRTHVLRDEHRSLGELLLRPY